MTDGEVSSSSLMKAVEAIAISPQDARAVAQRYETQARRSQPNSSDSEIQKLVTDKIISRYSKLAATSGAATALPGVIPGIGTAVGMIGGGLADVSVCMKLQIDMTMCIGSKPFHKLCSFSTEISDLPSSNERKAA